ncbi:helix-turn-helix domain-containing protein [Bradyrhizobium sp. INPA03-11B]|uniref:Crp/Fnr family transcriptional regulator n=1 Tax=Bradyrhizobium sp. INPA03-11B TaxID=418598 RepID=UPI00338DF557
MLELPQLRVRVLQHVQALLVHSSQVALCGVRHRLEERLACWLCLACRAGQSSVVPITHEDLSTILGMRRAGITEVLTRFERDGLIVKTRGALQVRDLHRLEQRACCCRRIICEAHR